MAESFISTSSSSSVPFDRHYESALVTSPAPVRGRLPKKSHVRSASRSASPSAAPTTPTDFMRGYPLPPLEDVIEGETSRGRKVFVGEAHTPRQRVDSDESEAGRWSSVGSVEPSRKRSLLSGVPRRPNLITSLLHADMHSSGRTTPMKSGHASRAESTPPIKEDGDARQGRGRGFLCASTSASPALLSAPLSNTLRSRSAGG
ncbi:hypothetical protein FIBSPDRAFT_868770 [Athelia psychrophila]|uniref:Uncharacterized protein n=1 Tax=Athelia psychrophila TaxID=1759441 RepID=A0A166CR12_9AGAM|nr:hypothetical protein FIBSPDRAFT_868770 [Fibularhizoctonia sp. CBS 109695]